MQKVFEKIIEKLEEYKYLYLVERDSEISQHCKDVVDCEEWIARYVYLTRQSKS